MIKISKNILSALGLNELQASVYVATLELGQATMQEISQKSGVKRTSIYNFIDFLKERQLITETKKNKRKVYSAINPEHLAELVKVKLMETQAIIPELLAIYNQKNNKPRVTYHEGLEGIKEVYADLLRTKGEVVSYEDLDYLKKMLPKDYYNYLPPERARRNIPLRAISKDCTVAREFIKNDLKINRTTRFIQTSEDLRTEINIYDNKVALISFRNDVPFGVLIEDRDISQTLKTT
jgi:sugar-specific transcriptional regulator TrmB